MESSQCLEEALIETGTNTIRESDSAATPVVVLSTLVAICGSFADGCSAGYSSPAQAGIMADLGLSLRQYSVFASITTAGGIIGSLINGKIADLIGRRCAMWLSQCFCIVGWLAIAFAEDAWWLYIGRFSTGIGVGIMTYVIPVYIAEITPKNIRGTFTAANTLVATSGISLMFLLGTVVSWKTLSLIAAIPCLVQVVGLFFIPESPRWLAKVALETELETSLHRLRGNNADISREVLEIQDYTKTFENDSEAGFFDLFQRRYAYSLIVGLGLMVLQPLGGSIGIAFYASSIFAEADLSSNIGTISMAIIQVPVVGVSVLLTDKTGRRPLLMASSIGMFLSLTIVALAFGLQNMDNWKEITPALVYIGIMGFSVAFPIGMLALPGVIMSEIFPMNIKGLAGSLVTLVHYCCNWIVTYTFGFMMEWSTTGTFSIFAVICAATVAFIEFLVPETKGRTLEEIQISITKFSK
ncbi:Sugar transporter ERD6-like [Melia azedarach]|uniref:Sugar transporter ERD6-like n=1 Tax=Melia azedarach TaxID=155640 RepID=A0ACC1Y8D4_MELAZ|nr:Sugar transporter ERD6-like [Melia azedarach]